MRRRHGVDVVVGIEARGFILAAPVAYRAGVGFVPVRKAGKLPAATLEQSLRRWSTARPTLEVHADAFAPGERVLVVDDVLATGGTAAAAAELVERAGGRGRRRRRPARAGVPRRAAAWSCPARAAPCDALLTV